MPKKYYIFGDSLMRGVMPDETGAYHASELIDFSQIAEKCNIEITNYAMPTFTTTRVLGWARSTMERVEKPDFVIIECGGNDCDSDWKAFMESRGKILQHRRTLDQFSEDYDELISFFERQGIPVIIALAPHIASAKYLRHLVETSPEIKKYAKRLPSVKQMEEDYLEYEKLMYQIANAHTCPIIVLQDKFEPLPDVEAYFSSDGMHPNEKGYKLIGESFLEYFQLAK